MNKICTSIEQSKKLMELGIDVNTANMCYYEYTSHIDGTPKVGYKESITEGIPAWSLSALLDLIPTSIDEYTDDFSQLELTKQSVSYVYATGNLRKGYLKDNLLDAAFEMVCWLKKEEYI